VWNLTVKVWGGKLFGTGLYRFWDQIVCNWIEKIWEGANCVVLYFIGLVRANCVELDCKVLGANCSELYFIVLGANFLELDCVILVGKFCGTGLCSFGWQIVWN
jgi:hypothetical protein